MNRQEPLIVHTECSLAWGGQEIRIFWELRELSKFGWNVQLWAPKRSDLYHRAKAVQIATEPVPYRWIYDVPSILAVRRLILERRPELLVTHSSIDSWIVGLATRTLSPPPRVVRVRHLSTPIGNILPYKWFPDKICTTSESIRQGLIQRGISDKQIENIPTGIDLSRFRPNPAAKSSMRKKYVIPDDRPVVGGVFVIRSWKGIYDFVKIAASIPSAHFVVAGDGPSRAAMESSAREAGLKDRLTFTGHIESVEEIFWMLDIFLFPSTANEGVPQAVLQAQACGIPVVASGLPSIREAVPGGIFCDPGDVGAFSSSIQKLVNDSSLAARMVQEGQDWVKQFDQTLSLRRIDGFYRSLMPAGIGPGNRR